MATSALCRPIKALLEKELAAAESLHDCLDREYAALNGTDFAAIEATTAQKDSELTALDRHTRERRRLLHSDGIQDTSASGWIERLDPADAHGLTRLWQRLQSLGRECQAQNERNGIVLKTRLRYAGHTLNILRGGEQRDGMYGPDGETHSEPDARSLARV